MATFKVGDRVRIVRQPPRFSPRSNGALIGKQATIVGLRHPVPNWPEGGYFLDVDGEGPISPRDGFPTWVLECQLEPILPTPCAADILAMANLPERDCIAPVRA